MQTPRCAVDMAQVRPKADHRANPRGAAVLDFVAFAARPMPLVTLLDEAPRRIALVVNAEVCSVYLMEGEGELVMRGNVGFAHGAIGQVRLAVGEGITGEAVEYMRPITAELAKKRATYKHFEDLGEERFPVFLAVPIRGRAGPVGAVVVQRSERAFDEHEIDLLVLLGALIAAGIRTAELIDAQRDKVPIRRAGGGTRKVTLPGRPLVPGRTIGAIAALRRPAARTSENVSASHVATGASKRAREQQMQLDLRLLKGAFDVAEKAIGALGARARQLDLESGFLGTYVEILGDSRFRERAAEIVLEGAGLAQALARVAREVTRTAATITRDPFLEERARDVEDLCDALTMLAAADKRAELPQKAVLVGDGLSVFDLLVSAKSHPVAVALSERAASPRTRVLVELLGVPAIADVQGLFRWASDGDLALVDADHGLVVINPSKSEIAALREWRREEERSRGEEE